MPIIAGSKPPQTENQGITFLRNLAKGNKPGEAEKIILSTHAINQMSSRCIEYDDVIRCMIDGYFIEFYKANNSNAKYPRVVFYDDHSTEIYAVTSFEAPDNFTSTVITACKVDWSVWEKKDEYIVRLPKGGK